MGKLGQTALRFDGLSKGTTQEGKPAAIVRGTPCYQSTETRVLT